MKFRWNSIFSLLLFLFSVLFQFARDTKNKNNPISQQNLSVWRVCARENEWSVVSWTKSCFLFRFFLCCCHKIKIPTKVWRFHQRPNHLAYIFKRFKKCSQNSPPKRVFCKKCSEPQKKNFKRFSSLLFLSILLFFANNTTNKSNEMTTTLTNTTTQKKKKSSSVLMVLFSILRTCALALITFPIAFVLHVFAVFLLPWEITKATASEIFSHRYSMKKTKTKTNDDSDDSDDDDDECVEGRRKERSRYRARFDASSRTGMVLPSKLCF